MPVLGNVNKSTVNIMNSLALIQNYDSSEDDEDEQSMKTRLPRPVLPEYKALRRITRQPDNEENDKRHQNRVRSFAHEAGNWATYVGISVPTTTEWYNLLEDLEMKLSGFNLKRVDNFHISLSRVVVLKYHWINGFIDSVRSIISDSTSFLLTLAGLSVFVNDEKTRTFLAIDVQSGKEQLNHLVDRLDACLTEYSLPKFYSNRLLHVSVLWGLGDISRQINSVVESLDVNQIMVPIMVNACFCKTGNKFYNFPLK